MLLILTVVRELCASTSLHVPWQYPPPPPPSRSGLAVYTICLYKHQDFKGEWDCQEGETPFNIDPIPFPIFKICGTKGGGGGGVTYPPPLTPLPIYVTSMLPFFKVYIGKWLWGRGDLINIDPVTLYSRCEEKGFSWDWGCLPLSPNPPHRSMSLAHLSRGLKGK